MSLKVVLFFLLVFCCVLMFSDGLKSGEPGVCEVKISQRKTRPKSYLATINKRCGKRKCTVKRTKSESYSVTKKQTVCCKGFEYRSESDICFPLCSTGCSGGRCIAPDVCVCEPPATLNENNTCIKPTCDSPCFNADCNANNTCVCNPSYTTYNATHCYKCEPGFIIDKDFNCSPICTTPCVNGNCSAPNTCTCHEGYRQVDEFKCEPSCEVCENAKCVAPNTCECFDGYERINETNCEPKCDLCTNGRCIGPNQCECDKGYIVTDGNCEPVCDNTCINGICIAPNVCACNEGYIENGTSKICTKICSGDVQDKGCVPENCQLARMKREGMKQSPKITKK